MKLFKKKTDPKTEMTQEKLRDMEEYIRYRISQTTPEEQRYGEQKIQLRGDLGTHYGNLMQRLDENGLAILDEYMECYEKLMKLEKDASFLEGRTVALLVLDLKKKLKKSWRK